MRFRDVAGVGVIRRGWSDADVSVFRQGELTTAVRIFEALRDAVLSPGQSRQLIRKVTGGWR
jgi:hypothetical protein